MAKYDVYFGTMGSRGGTGIYKCVFDEADGSLETVGYLDGLYNASYTNFDLENKVFFSVAKSKETNLGYIRTWTVAPDGALTEAGKFSTGGQDPCYVMVDRTNTYAAAANYVTHNFRIWRFDQGGQMEQVGRQHVINGSGPDPRRQRNSYAHSTVWSPWDDVLYVCDLGSDHVFRYRKEGDTFRMAGSVKVKPGSGPRHLTFHPEKRIAYLLNEMGSAVTVFKVAEGGALRQLQHISTLPPEGSEAENNCAEIHVSTDGRFVYASNRGHDSIAIYDVLEDGALSVKDYAPSHGSMPRGFDISPNGEWMLVGGQDSGNMAVFSRDKDTGLITFVRSYEGINATCNVRFFPIAKA